MPAKDLVFRFLGVDAGAGREFDRIGGKASKTEGLIGKFALGFVAAGATVAAVSIKMADEFDSADARMRQAFKNSGHSADQYKGRIALVSKQLEDLGFTHAQTEIGLGNLTTALRSPAKAFKDIGIAADLARFKHIDLGTAATVVAKAEEGNLKVLKQLGIDLPVTTGGVSKLVAARAALGDAVTHLNQLEDLQHQKAHLTLADHYALENAQKKVADAQKKVNDAASAGKIIHQQLAQILGGQAQAAAGTLAGKEQILRSKLTDLGVELGHKLIPALTTLVDYTNKHVVPTLEGFAGWVSRNKRPIEDIAKVLAAIAAFKFASNKLNDIGKLLGFGGRGVGGVAGQLNVQKVFVVNWPPGSFAPGGSPVGTAGRDAATAGEEGAARGSKSVIGRVAEKIGIKGASRGALTLAGPLTDVALLATGDSAPQPPLASRKNLYAALYSILDPKGHKEFPSADISGGKLDAGKAVGTLLGGSATQVAQLKEAAKLYPQIAAAVKGYQSAIENANDSIGHEKSSLAALAAAEVHHTQIQAAEVAAVKKIPGAWANLVKLARSQGVSIGQALDEGVAVGIAEKQAQAAAQARAMGIATWQATAKALEVSSPSKKGVYLGQMLAQGLAVGYVGEAAKVLTQFSKSTDKMLLSIGGQAQSAIGKYQSDLAARTSFRQGLQQSLAGAGDIGGATVLGGDGPSGGVRGFLTSQSGALRTLAISLGKLRKLGLSPALLAQIANAGPQQGVLLAQEILSGSDGSVRSLNRIESSIQTYANTAAGTVANAQFGRTLTHDLAAIATLAKSVEHLAAKSGRWNAADMHTFASVLARELSRILKIPLSDIDQALGIKVRSGH